MPTVIGRSTCKKDRQKRPRPARGVREGLSWMRGNSHVQFLGGGEVVILPRYPAWCTTCWSWLGMPGRRGRSKGRKRPQPKSRRDYVLKAGRSLDGVSRGGGLSHPA